MFITGYGGTLHNYRNGAESKWVPVQTCGECMLIDIKLRFTNQPWPCSSSTEWGTYYSTISATAHRQRKEWLTI